MEHDITPEELVAVNGDVLETSGGLISVDEVQSIEIEKQIIGLREMMEYAKFLAESTITPIAYQHRPENCYVALDMAVRMGVSPLMVMQNLYVIQGKPSFSGQAISAMINSNPSLRDVELHYVGTENTDSWGAYVTATKVKTGKQLKGGTVTIAIAKKEGWYQKSGSKWQTMPEIMLCYRAYAWFGRMHTPESMMGLQSTDELDDVNTPELPSPVVNPFNT